MAVALACLVAGPVLAGAGPEAVERPGSVDKVVLGDLSSEESHSLTSDHAETIAGAMGLQARRLLPLSPASFDGGAVSFTMKVDPQAQNYVTVKLWGSDKGEGAGRLILWANGMQVGYRHEGDYDVLNQCDSEGLAPECFVYQTLPLPMGLTRGKTSVELKISALGPMWPYGQTFARYQKDLTEPSRGIYGVYVHTNTRFVPDATEKQGHLPEATVRSEAGDEIIAQSKAVVIDRLNHLMGTAATSPKSLSAKDRSVRMILLANAYNVRWTPAYQNGGVIGQLVQDGDAFAGDYAADPKRVEADWSGAAPLGEAIARTWPAMSKHLDETTTIDGKSMPRREAWAIALQQSVDYWRTHRRSYTNQSVIVDAGIYMANRALLLVDPQRAISQEHALHLLYQAVGIEPWLGSDPRPDGKPVADSPDRGAEKPYGDGYSLITRKGLSRELGWVATYGETILHFSCDMANLTGDEKIRQQVAKIARARLYFRYPALDADGFKCMKLASEIDNRTAHYPLSGSAYVVPNIREEWWTDVPALLSDDPVIVGAAQQSIADNQYFAYVKGRLKDPDTLGMMRNVDDYAKVKSLPPADPRLPMTPGHPDFVFADEQDAIIALKRGDTSLFFNFYYRSERAVNNVVRIFETTPTITRIATVRGDTVVNSSGKTYTRPDWIDWTRTKGMPPPGQDLHQAWAGEEMPIAARPSDAVLPRYGDWGPFLGKADVYRLRYGDYYICMNSSEDKTYPFDVSSEFMNARDLVSGKSAGELGRSIQPLSTIVLYRPPASKGPD